MKNLMQNEIDVLTEIYTKLTQFELTLEEYLKRTSADKTDYQFILNEYKIIVNQAINTALQNNKMYDYFNYNNVKNKVLPNMYVKPGYESTIINLYKLNAVQLNQINEQIKKLVKQ